MNTNKTLRQQLETDLQKLNDLPRTPECDFAYFLYFGNFCTRLPGGFLRAESGNEKWARIVATEKPDAGSELARSQTYGEFYLSIDTVLEEEGLPIDKVRRLNTKPSRELYELVAPAYIRLREMGYSEYDLKS